MGCCQHSHKSPAFPLTYSLWRFPANPFLDPVTQTGKCQLYVNAHLDIMQASGFAGNLSFARFLYLPKGTDIRFAAGTAVGGARPDVVAVPQGTDRLYVVLDVDDVGKGFENEFRVALLTPYNVSTPPAWTVFPYR